MKIALVIIAKDEGAVLKRCIDSFQHVVDEIHVADTGSNDHTVELARSCGATVRFYEEVEGEPFNYGRARNFAQECVKADYIFSVDADEYLHPDSKHTFRARVAEYMRAAPTAFIPIWSGYNRETLQRPVHEHVLVRLFKRGREWKYRIHEVVVAQLGTVFGRDIVLLHDKVEKGKTSPESMAKRMEIYFQNMELDKKETRPTDSRARCTRKRLLRSWSILTFPSGAKNGHRPCSCAARIISC
jgi:glycosyltransferase involved in cell wall biosynthesis